MRKTMALIFMIALWLFQSGYATSFGLEIDDAEYAALRDTIAVVVQGESKAIDAFQCALDDVMCIRTEIAERYRIDQWIRREFGARTICGEYAQSAPRACFSAIGIVMVTEIDVPNTVRLKELVDHHGWLATESWGAETENAAWFLAQHGSMRRGEDTLWDLEFAQSILPDIQASVLRGNLSPWHYAAMYDRIQETIGKLQRYGTQFSCVDGRWIVRDLEAPDKVDGYRAEIGMEPLDKAPKPEGDCGGN